MTFRMPRVKNKKRIREKASTTYSGKNLRIILVFSAQILKAKKSWNYILQALKNNCQPRRQYQV
jgi:hypothetical protein